MNHLARFTLLMTLAALVLGSDTRAVEDNKCLPMTMNVPHVVRLK